MRFILLLLIPLVSYSQSVMFPGPGLSVSGGSSVATPVDSPGAGTYTTPQSVTLLDATPSATVCYRTDGVNPSASTPGSCDVGSTAYMAPFNISVTTTLKALGTKIGLSNSGIMTSVYTIVTARQFLVPTVGYLNQVGTTRKFLIPGSAYAN